MIAILILWNMIFVRGVHSIAASYFNITFRGLTISTKPDRNFLIKLIFPKNDFNSFLLFEKGIWDMAYTLEGSLMMPPFIIIYPSNLPSIITRYISLDLGTFHISDISPKQTRGVGRVVTYLLKISLGHPYR